MIQNFIASLGYGNVVIILCILIIIHELGHYIAARLMGVTVHVFSVGFGKEIFGLTSKNGTRWRVSLLPLGGYVQMAGNMIPLPEHLIQQQEQHLSMEEKQQNFHHKNVWQRMIIVAAGPIANFSYAVIVISLIAFFIGIPQNNAADKAIIGLVHDNTPAHNIGLKQGDIITHVNTTSLHSFDDLRQAILTSNGQSLTLTFMRDGGIYHRVLTPKTITRNNKKIYIMGAAPPPTHYKKQPIWDAIITGFSYTGILIYDTLHSLATLISYSDNGLETTIGGPIMIAELSKDFANLGLVAFLSFTAILSINLGLINLLPIPVLDGGHLLFLIIEKILGKPLPYQTQQLLTKIFSIVLIALIIIITYHDIKRIVF